MWISRNKYQHLINEINRVEGLVNYYGELIHELERSCDYEVGKSRDNNRDLHKRIDALPEELGYKRISLPEETVYIKIRKD